jgi:hypothetical protein
MADRLVSLVKSGKNGPLGGVSSIKTLLIAACALCLAGCASTGTKSAPSLPDRIALKPSDDAYKVAMESLSAPEQGLLKKGLGFTVDTLLKAPIPIETMTWSRRRADTPLSVNLSDFVRFVNLKQGLKGGTRANLAMARVLAGLTFDSATFNPVFRIQVEVEPSSGAVMTATAVGSGPACRRPGDEAPGSPGLTRSEQIAFMKAFLKTLLRVNEQLQQL